MKAFAKVMILFIIMSTLVFTLISCNKEKTPAKEAVKEPPEHTKIVEAYRKSLGDAKKNIVASVNSVNITGLRPRQ